MRVIFIQTAVADYRARYFDILEKRLVADGGSLQVYGGDEGFDFATASAAAGRSWYRPVRSRFLFAKKMLWLRVPLSLVFTAETVVVPLNPRIITSWVFLLVRAALRRPTIVYGHAWSRSGSAMHKNLMRLMQMYCATSVLVYTYSELKLLRSRLNSVQIAATGNSGVSTNDCNVEDRAAGSTFLYVGRLVPQKRVELLMDAFCRYANDNRSGARLIVIGGGPCLDKMRAQAVRFGCIDRVDFLGWIWDPGLLAKYYRDCIASISPGFVGLSCIQSFAMGVPMIIADDEPHSPEVEACVAGFNCRFFQAGAAQSLAKAMEQMFRTRDEWALRGPEIAEHVRLHYTLEGMAERTHALLLNSNGAQ